MIYQNEETQDHTCDPLGESEDPYPKTSPSYSLGTCSICFKRIEPGQAWSSSTPEQGRNMLYFYHHDTCVQEA